MRKYGADDGSGEDCDAADEVEESGDFGGDFRRKPGVENGPSDGEEKLDAKTEGACENAEARVRVDDEEEG